MRRKVPGVRVAVRALLQCRTDLHDVGYRRADAPFDLMNALLTMGSVPSPAHLSLARGIVADQRLPWERPIAPGTLTPYRVQRTFSALLPHLDSLASAPNLVADRQGVSKADFRGIRHAFRPSNAAPEHQVRTFFEQKAPRHEALQWAYG